MSNLMDFLIDNINATEEVQEVSIGGRLKDFKFKIKPLNNKDFNKIKEQCRTIRKKQVTFDEARFNEMIIAKSCIEPNFNNMSDIEKAGCKTPADLINKTLKAGEIVDLSNSISNASGFDVDPDTLVEEAKN